VAGYCRMAAVGIRNDETSQQLRKENQCYNHGRRMNGKIGLKCLRVEIKGERRRNIIVRRGKIIK
jgi:hypothetical protein